MSTRRNFLKQVGCIAAAAAIPDISAIASEKKDSIKFPGRKIQVDSTWDVVVVGGGPAGCAAAISAAREGAKTLIIENNGILGGMGTAGLVPAWTPFSDGRKMIYRGLAEKVFVESKKGVPHEPSENLDWVSINPEHLIRLYDRLVTEAGVKVLFFSRVCSVEMSSDERVDAVVVANKLGLTAFKAKVFIDATGDGDVAAWAGCSFTRGYDDDGTNQQSTLCFEFSNIDTEDYKNGPKLFNGPKSPIGQAVRMKKWPLIDGHFCNNLVGPGVLGMNAGHMRLDTLDPWKVSDAMIKGREIAQQYLEAMKAVRPTTFKDAFVSRTAAVLGVRDSRRIEGDYILTGDDWRARRTFEDEIGRNSYYLDVHGRPNHDRYAPGDSHGIPYRCLTPKGKTNLLTAGRCISADWEVYGSVRVMPCCLVTGEAAGMAAKHAIDKGGCDVHKVDVKHLRARLLEEGQYLL